MADRTRPRSVLAIWVAAIIAGGLAVIAFGGPGPIAAQSPPADTAVVTLLNLTPGSRTVEVQSLATGISSSHTVPSQGTLTVDVAAGADPVDMVTRCGACHSVHFAVARGQRLIVVLAPLDEPAIARADLYIVNEGDGRRQGVVRTGAAVGKGRSLLTFDLRPGEEVHVGLRTAGAVIDLNLRCFGCGSQHIRMTDAVELHVVIE